MEEGHLRALLRALERRLPPAEKHSTMSGRSATAYAARADTDMIEGLTKKLADEMRSNIRDLVRRNNKILTG